MFSGEGMRLLKAEAAACSGSEIALHPFVNPGSSNLSGQVQSGASYEARLTGEGTQRAARLALCDITAKVLKEGLGVLGIEVTETM